MVIPLQSTMQDKPSFTGITGKTFYTAGCRTKLLGST